MSQVLCANARSAKMGNQQCCAKPTHEGHTKDGHADKGGSKDESPAHPDQGGSNNESPAAIGAWVEKQGVIHKTWKRRWFRLEDTRLTYSTSPKSSKCEGVIRLKTIAAVNIIGETSSWVGNHPKWYYEFEIVCDITNHVHDTIEASGWTQRDVGKDERGMLVRHERRYRLRMASVGPYKTFVDAVKATAESASVPAPEPALDSEEGVPPATEVDQAAQEMELKAARDSVKMARLAAAADAAHKAKEEAEAAAKAHAEAEAALERAARAKAEEAAAFEARLAREAATAQAAKEAAEQEEKARIAAKEEAARVAQAEAAARQAAVEKVHAGRT